MKMHDMGYKMEQCTVSPENSKKQEMMYPSFHIENNVPMNLMKKEVGDECEFMVKGIVKSKEMTERDGKKSERMTLEVHKIGYGDSKEDSKEHMSGKSKKMVDNLAKRITKKRY